MDSIELPGGAAAENLGGGLQDIVPRQGLRVLYVSSLHVPLLWPSRLNSRTEFNSGLRSTSSLESFPIFPPGKRLKVQEESVPGRSGHSAKADLMLYVCLCESGMMGVRLSLEGDNAHVQASFFLKQTKNKYRDGKCQAHFQEYAAKEQHNQK